MWEQRGRKKNSLPDFVEEIKRRGIIGNRCYYGMLKLMRSELLKRKSKCQVYKAIMLPTVLCASERWTLSKAHEAPLGDFERKMLRRIYGVVQNNGGPLKTL
jgi:hypothetical protein